MTEFCRKYSLPYLLLLVLFFLAGCQSGPVAKGKEIFARYCSPCHGTGGAGDGYNAVNLDPHARDLTDASEPYMAKLSNEEIYDVISKGGYGVDLAPTMPVWGSVFSEVEIWSLVAYIRTLHKHEGKDVPFDEKKPYSDKRPHLKPVTEEEYLSLRAEKITDDTVLSEQVAAGEALFQEQGCIGCHRVRGTGGQLGPDLSRAGFMLQEPFIYRWIRNPQSFKPNTRMANLNLSAEDALAITLYVKSLKDPPPE